MEMTASAGGLVLKSAVLQESFLGSLEEAADQGTSALCGKLLTSALEAMERGGSFDMGLATPYLDRYRPFA